MIDGLIELLVEVFGSVFGDVAEDNIKRIWPKWKRCLLWFLLILDFILVLAILVCLTNQIHWAWPLSFFGGMVLTTMILILLLIKWRKK